MAALFLAALGVAITSLMGYTHARIFFVAFFVICVYLTRLSKSDHE